MNIVEDFKSFLASFTGLTAELRKHGEDLKSAIGAIAAKDQEIVDLKAKLKDAPSADALKAAQDQVTALTAEVGTEKLRAEKAEKDLVDYKAEAPQRENLAAAHIAASNGLPGPVATTGANKGDEEKKPDFSNLTGLAKVSAVFAAKSSK